MMRRLQIFQPLRCSRAVIVIAWLAAWAATAPAQTTPQLRYVFPPGAQCGTTVEVQVGGEYLPGPGRLSSADDRIVVATGADEEHRRLTVAADAEPGSYELRLSTVQGASGPLPFVVGELPEIVHRGGSQPLTIDALPVTVNGRLAADGDLAEFVLTPAAGEQIVCAAMTRKIQSPIDPLLRLLDAEGRVVAEGFASRSADGVLVYRSPRGGRYRLQLYDFQMNGGPEYVYRLTLTTGPWIERTYPVGVSRTATTPLGVYGWNLPSPDGEPFVQTIAPQTGERFELQIAGAANRPTLPVSDFAGTVESEPNDAAGQAMSLSLPTTIEGRLERTGDVDTFVFQAAKKEKVALDVEALELDFPLDGVLAVHDEAGKLLVELDDAKTSRDPSLRFTAPVEGRYFVSLRDRVRGGGPDYVYRLHASSPRPRLTARVNSASLLVPTGQTMNLPVLVERVDGLEGELEVTAVGLPAGVAVTPQLVPAKTPATVQLPFVADAKALPSGKLIEIVVRTKADGQASDEATTIVERARIAESATATRTSRALWLAVGPEVPFTLKISTTILDAPRLAAFPFPVSVVRKEGFTGPIRLVGVEPDRRGTLKPLVGEIAADADAGSIPLVLQQQVIEGTTHRCRVMGVAEVTAADGRTYPVFHIATGNMSLGCQPSLLTLTAVPTIVAWTPGGAQQIEVRLARRAALQPVRLAIESTADTTGIGCRPVDVAAGSDRAILELRFPEGPPPTRRTTVMITAESARDGLPVFGKAALRIEPR
jgi:hypothetical protein